VKTGTLAMIDEMARLRATEGLCELLRHYATLAAPDRQVWQDRLAELTGVSPRELVQFHGELMAYGWLEQNTGQTPVLRVGSAPACYRVTPAGLRALKNLHAEPAEAAGV
jgi:hypothetical protein